MTRIIAAIAVAFSLWHWRSVVAEESSSSPPQRTSSMSSLRGLSTNQTASTVDCRVIVLETVYHSDQDENDKENRKIECCLLSANSSDGRRRETDQCPSIHLPTDLISQHETQLRRGEVILSIPDAIIDRKTIHYPENASIQVSHHDLETASARRRLVQSTGRRSVLTIRVSTRDSLVGFSTSELYDLMFDDQRGSVKTQMESCSFRKLGIVPSRGGVLDVYLPAYASSVPRDEMVDLALAEAKKKLSLQDIGDAADFIRVCLPPGTGNWVALAAKNHWKSVYNDLQCGYLSVTMHEFG
jgi:hypothetical protein